MNVHYYSRKNLSKQSPVFIKKKKRKNVTFVVSVFIIVLTFIISSSAFSRLSSLTIGKINIEFDKGVVDHKITALVSEIISHKYLNLFSKSNIYLYPKKEIISFINKNFPETGAISMSIGPYNSLDIRIKEKNATAIICPFLPDFSSEERDKKDSEDCYYADKKGFVYAKAPDFSGSVYKKIFLPELTNISTSTPIIGNLATSTEVFTGIVSFMDRVEKNNIYTESILVKEDGEYELYVYNPVFSDKTASTTDASIALIYFGAHSELDKELSNLIAFWNNMTGMAKEKKSQLEFQNIDVRHGNHIYYTLMK